MNNVITASRMMGMNCLRKSFWRSEIGLQRTEQDYRALRFGTAWHNGMEARWKGAPFEDVIKRGKVIKQGALSAAIPEGVDLDAYDCATISALLAAYYDYYGESETEGSIQPEVEFHRKVEINGETFTFAGKIDGLGVMKSGLQGLVESKTTSDSISPDSDYWLRLAFNVQVLHYICEARELGHDPQEVFYDVTRKPSIRPLSAVNDLDEQGRKIVIDRTGKRIYKQKIIKIETSKKRAKIKTFKTEQVDDLENPRQSADVAKGWFVKSHPETPEEFSDRLWKDAKERPEFYFCRKEIPVMEDLLESLKRHRKAVVMLIQSLRNNESSASVGWLDNNEQVCRDPDAWPRNISEATCNFCEFKSFCLQNITVDISNPPSGFEIKQFNQELKNHATTT